MKITMRTGSADRASAGFTLLEVLIAMMILSVGAASVLSLFAAAASTHRRARDRTHAALVAERIFAEIQGRYTAGLEAKALSARLVKDLPKQFGEYAWEVFLYHPGQTDAALRARAVEGGDPTWQEDELFARVLVRWKQSGQARSESYFTILLPRNTGEETDRPRMRKGRLVGGK